MINKLEQLQTTSNNTTVEIIDFTKKYNIELPLQHLKDFQYLDSKVIQNENIRQDFVSI